MLNRQSTLGKNIGIYALYPLLLLVHAYWWGAWLKGTQGKLETSKKQLQQMEEVVRREESDTHSFKETVKRTQEILDDRQKELEDMGPFLPSIREKGSIMEQIQGMIQNLGIRIVGMDSPQAEGSGEGGYFTFNFSMELVGPYRAFKQLLAKIQQTPIIIRISNFKVDDYGPQSPVFDWKVRIQFQTYFGR